ncbi:MAG: carboxypeptidase regulatory-like domain-containing protein [Polyangia bacterium]
MRQTPCGPRGAAFLSAPRRRALGLGPVRLIALAPLLLLFLLAPRLAHAVGELGGSIGGYVTIKGTKDGISSVPVTIRSKVLIGGPQQAATSDDGSYAFQNLPPGKYELEVRMEGFAPVRMVNILVNSGARSSVDVELEVVTSTQHNETTRIIEKTNPILNAESAAATTPISNAQITRAPTFRQEKGVAQYTAGVSQGTDRAQVRGGLGRFNRYYIDGLEVTDITTGAFGTSSALINSDSVEQFAVSVGAMDAEYNSLGLVQNMVTRSGGNKLIVDTSIIFQPPFVSDTTRYPARQPLYNGALQYDDRPLPDRSFYSAAINIGGPIIKDKLWFWTNFQFNFNRLTFNIAEQSWYPGLQKAYDRYQDQVLYLGRVKLTWQASKSTRVTLSYSTDFNDIVNASAYSYGSIDASTLAPEAERRWQRGGHWVGLLIDSLLTDKLLLQLQTGVFYKHFLDETQLLRSGQPDRVTASHQLQTADAATNNFVYLNGTRPWDDQTKWSAQLAPTLMYTARGLGGTHNIKGGLQFTYMHYSHNTGVAGGQRFLDTVPGLPCDAENPATFSSCRQVEVFPDSLPAGGQAGAGYTTTAQAINLGLFLQDRFVFKRWLTIVPGIRVDTGMLYNTEGVRMQTLVGFGPRLSLIYDLFHDRTTLIKAHYGRHNDMGNAGIADVGNPTMSSIIKRWNPATSSFEDFRRTGGAGSQTFAAEVNLTPPKVDEVSVGVHREVTEQTVVGVDYTYRAYGNFWVNEETNQIWDPAGLRVVGTVNGQSQRLYSATTPSDARRDYHGVDFWVRGNPGRWDMTASYTLAFLNGNVNEFFESQAYRYNPRLSPLFYGPIAGAPRHYLKGLINYAFEFGLTIGARLQYFSGTPQWKQFQSPEDATYTLYRSPRGSSTGSRNNDPTTWADFRLPDTFNLDLQIAYSLEKLTGQRIDIIAMLFNLLNLSPATAIETRDGATFGVVTRRPDNLFCEFVVRYRY